jgi:hypothetical protein
MMRWLKVQAAIVLGIAPCAVVFLWLGYRLDWPTLVYAVAALAVADIVRGALR